LSSGKLQGQIAVVQTEKGRNERRFKTQETLDKVKIGILYNDQENNHSHDNKENSCCRYQKKMRKIREEMLSAWSA
jgi:hypothetical protein